MLRALLVGLVATFLAGSVAPQVADARTHVSSVKKHPRAHKAKAKRSAKRKAKRAHKKAKRTHRHVEERRPLPP